MGEELENLAKEASSAGRHITASGFNLRACMYYQTGERFRQPKDDKALEVCRRAVNCFKEAAKYLEHPSIEPVEIPYEGGKSLPALFIKASTEEKGPLPTVIFCDGLDVTKEVCYFWGVRDMVRRGLACLIVDGPGNGESIRFRGLKLRYDYEVPAGAAVDYLEGRKDVDPKRIGIMALSLGGYYAPRAAAFEKRLQACVAWGAQYDYHALWKRRVELAYQTALSVPPDHIQWVLGANSMEDVLKRLEKFKLSGVVERIECPFLLVHGEEDAQVSLTDAHTCFNAVGSKDKTLRVFTAEEGGSQHCQNDRLGVAIPYMHDWLAEKLKA
jgi:dipeptidyl aminopeptidase/acylaminoacyl peptidase